jgi:hypothetical protein
MDDGTGGFGGLLDFAKSPVGMGLLSAVAGGLAGARRGAPLNSLGSAGLAGLSGYSNAQQQQTMNQYKDMQAAQIGMALQKQKAAMGFFNKLNGQQSDPSATPAGQSVPVPGPGMMTTGLSTGDPYAGSMPVAAGPSAGFTPPTPGAGTPPSQQANNAFPMGLKDIAAYQMLGLDGGGTLLDLYKQANNPQERKGGNYYVDPRTGAQTYMPKLAEGVTMGPNGQAMPVQGAAQANAGYKGAEAGAVAGAQFPYAVGQKAAEQRGAAQLDPMQVIGPDGQAVYVNRLNVSGGAGGAQGQGGQPGGYVAGRNPVTQAANQDINKNWITATYQPTLDAGKSATDMSNSINAVRNIDPSTGWGTEAKATAANFLAGLGIAPKNAEMYASNAQKVQSVAMDRLLTVLGAQKGPQTEGDAQRASQTFVSLKNTPDANNFILDFAQAKANQDARKAQFYEQALPLAQKEGDLPRVDREWRKIQGSIWADPTLARWQKK